MRIVEDVYRSDLVVYIGVYIRVIIKALMKFDTRYIAKGHVFTVFDCLLSSIFKGGGLSITSINILQALPNIFLYSHIFIFLYSELLIIYYLYDLAYPLFYNFTSFISLISYILILN